MDDQDQEHNLKWNNHTKSVLEVFRDIRTSARFSDVVLFSHGHVFNAHKMVLAACSEYFDQLLSFSDKERPFIMLELKPMFVQGLLDYMYIGEVQMKTQDVKDFLDAAQMLKIKGLYVPPEEQQRQKDLTVAATRDVAFGMMHVGLMAQQYAGRAADRSRSPPPKRKRVEAPLPPAVRTGSVDSTASDVVAPSCSTASRTSTPPSTAPSTTHNSDAEANLPPHREATPEHNNETVDVQIVKMECEDSNTDGADVPNMNGVNSVDEEALIRMKVDPVYGQGPLVDEGDVGAERPTASAAVEHTGATVVVEEGELGRGVSSLASTCSTTTNHDTPVTSTPPPTLTTDTATSPPTSPSVTTNITDSSDVIFTAPATPQDCNSSAHLPPQESNSSTCLSNSPDGNETTSMIRTPSTTSAEINTLLDGSETSDVSLQQNCLAPNTTASLECSTDEASAEQTSQDATSDSDALHSTDGESCLVISEVVSPSNTLNTEALADESADVSQNEEKSNSPEATDALSSGDMQDSAVEVSVDLASKDSSNNDKIETQLESKESVQEEILFDFKNDAESDAASPDRAEHVQETTPIPCTVDTAVSSSEDLPESKDSFTRSSQHTESPSDRTTRILKSLTQVTFTTVSNTSNSNSSSLDRSKSSASTIYPSSQSRKRPSESSEITSKLKKSSSISLSVVPESSDSKNTPSRRTETTASTALSLMSPTADAPSSSKPSGRSAASINDADKHEDEGMDFDEFMMGECQTLEPESDSRDGEASRESNTITFHDEGLSLLGLSSSVTISRSTGELSRKNSTPPRSKNVVEESTLPVTNDKIKEAPDDSDDDIIEEYSNLNRRSDLPVELQNLDFNNPSLQDNYKDMSNFWFEDVHFDSSNFGNAPNAMALKHFADPSSKALSHPLGFAPLPGQRFMRPPHHVQRGRPPLSNQTRGLAPILIGPSASSNMNDIYNDMLKYSVTTSAGAADHQQPGTSSGFCANRTVKGFMCPLCNKTFEWASLLNTHLRIHTGEKPYGCPKCPYRSTQKGNVQRHIHTKHVLRLGRQGCDPSLGNMGGGPADGTHHNT